MAFAEILWIFLIAIAQQTQSYSWILGWYLDPGLLTSRPLRYHLSYADEDMEKKAGKTKRGKEKEIDSSGTCIEADDR
jgi:hypothetical protein